MASRGFARLRALWTTCHHGTHEQHYAQTSSFQNTNPSISRVSSMVFCRFSTAQAATKEPATTAEGEAVKKKRKKRKKTFMEVAQFLPDWGQGAKFTKSHWPPGNFYKVTKVKIYKSGRHGAAWGIFHEEEVPKTGDTQKIGGVNKRCWRYVPERNAAATIWKQSESERPVKHVPLTTAEVATSTSMADV